MTIFSLAMAILKSVNVAIDQQQQILAEQKQLAQQNTALQESVNALAETQEKQGEILDKILTAVQGGPVGVTARIILGTPIPQ